jgi:hypothetical protein
MAAQAAYRMFTRLEMVVVVALRRPRVLRVMALRVRQMAVVERVVAMRLQATRLVRVERVERGLPCST